MGKIVLTDHFEARTLTDIITVRPWFNSLFFPQPRRNTLLTDTAVFHSGGVTMAARQADPA